MFGSELEGSSLSTPRVVYSLSYFKITLKTPSLWLWLGISFMIKVCYSSPPIEFNVNF